MGLINKISERIGFTRTEVKVVIFLLFFLAAGYLFRVFYLTGNSTAYKEFNYAGEDSLFNAAENNEADSNTGSMLISKKNNYKNEVLGLNRNKFYQSARKVLPAEKSININKAGLNDLTKLPGIGPKTARKIIEYRKLNGNFTTLKDILKVKGIGAAKFSNIKKYLYIESR